MNALEQCTVGPFGSLGEKGYNILYYSSPPPYGEESLPSTIYRAQIHRGPQNFWPAPCSTLKRRSVLPLAEAGKFARARRRSRREPQVRAPHSHAAQPAQPAQRLRPGLTPNNRPSLASTRCHSHSKATRRASSRVRRPVQGGISRCAHPCVTLRSLRGVCDPSTRIKRPAL